MMRVDPTLQMFLKMVRKHTVLPAPVHRAAWRYAQQTGAEDLAELLIRRADAPADLVSEYAALSDPGARAVYLSRAALSGADAAASIAGETRGPALAEALARSQNHPAVIAAAAAVFTAKPTKALVHHIRTLPTARMTPAIVEGIVTVYDRARPGQLLDSGLDDVAGMLGPRRARALLAKLRHPQAAAALLRYDVGDDAVIETVRRLGPPAVAAAVAATLAERGSVVPSGIAADLLVAAATGRGQGGDVLGTIEAVLAANDPDNVTGLRARLAMPGPAVLAWPAGAGDESRVVVTDAELAPAPSGPAAAGDYATLRRAAASDRSTVLAEVADVVTGEPSANHAGWKQVASTLLWNAHLDVADRHRVTEALAKALEASVPNPRGEDLDPIVMFPGDQTVARIWCRHVPDEVVLRHGWEPFGGRACGQRRVPGWACGDGPRDRRTFEMALAAGFDPGILLDLPMPALAPLLRDNVTGAAAGTMLVHMTALVADALGDSAAAWSLFQRLHDTFTGSLADLLATCQAAAA